MRKTAVLLFAAVLLCLRAPALEREPWPEFAARRARLMEKLPDGVTVLFAYTAIEGESLRNAFRQESNFYYLTGWNEPGAILMLSPARKEAGSPAAHGEEIARQILFLPPRNRKEERWTGVKIGPHDEGLQEKTGFATVREVSLFERELSQALAGFGKVYTLKPREPAADRETNPSRYQTLSKIVPLAEISDARSALTEMRMVKSPGEISLIQKATDATVAAHLAAWKRARPGLYEYQIAATMMGVLFDRGCERTAYSPIVGSGIDSTILHYAANDRRMDAGDLLLMDVAGEYSLYATDVTRTIPVDGRFTARQREIYDIVRGAQNAAIQAIKPGMTIARSGPRSLHQIAFQYIDTHGKDREGNSLGKYFIHGLSHHVGLEVHDPSVPDAPLEPGMVITIEPGIYIPEEKIGVRIEDTVLVTETGARVLSGDLPRDPHEIERLMQR
jgi:Xaa-Pro aminopeptidase